MSFEYQIKESNGIFYCFAFDSLKRPAGQFKAVVFEDVVNWICEKENISVFPSLEDNRPFFTTSYTPWR